LKHAACVTGNVVSRVTLAICETALPFIDVTDDIIARELRNIETEGREENLRKSMLICVYLLLLNSLFLFITKLVLYMWHCVYVNTMFGSR